jgi:hypothetical protein
MIKEEMRKKYEDHTLFGWSKLWSKWSTF